MAVCLSATAQTTNSFTAAVDPQRVLVNSFEGWGTSLAWWGNLVGGYANRNAYAFMAFTQLQLNIVRYNIGGGENPGISNTMQIRARMPGFEPSPGVWDWSADANQRWMLREAVALGVNHVEAFANSPPWWMTVSRSVTGSTNGTSNNLQTNYEPAFAAYLDTVMSNLTVLDGVTFETVTPLNEPTSSWWTYGGSQEGCHISSDQQARIVDELHADLAARGSNTGIASSEDNDEQSTINSLSAYSSVDLANVARVTSHTYGANNPAGLRNLAAMQRKPLWVSEYGDGDATGMTMARRIHDDLTQLWPRAWVYWQVVDSGSWGIIYNSLDGSGNTSYTINEKFYVMGQFSRFIRPGYEIINVGDSNSVAAYSVTNRVLVIVGVNDSTNWLAVTYDLSGFNVLPAQASVVRSSASESLLAQPSLSVTARRLRSVLPPHSVTTHVLNGVAAAPPSSQPVAWYPFEGNALDATGNGNNGLIFEPVVFVPGKLGAQAAQFDGASSYVQIPRSVSNDFTLSLWVKTTATGGTGQWWAGKGLLDGEVTGTVDDFGLTLVGGQAGFGIGNPDTTVTSQTAINDGHWHHVAATRDATSGQMLLYIDGTLEAGTNGPTGTKAAPSSLRIGSIQAGYAGGFLAATVDDVQLFQRVFAASEIGLLMNHPPVLAPVPDASILAGRTLVITNQASDPDQPAETLRWSLVSPPPGAGINASTGLFAWRPAVESSPATNGVTVVVTDNGTPSMSATQVFSVLVERPTAPEFTGPVWSNGMPTFTVNGDDGPDYLIEAADTLVSPVEWLTVATNQSASPPFAWTDLAATNFNQRFYRVRLGP